MHKDLPIHLRVVPQPLVLSPSSAPTTPVFLLLSLTKERKSIAIEACSSIPSVLYVLTTVHVHVPQLSSYMVDGFLDLVYISDFQTWLDDHTICQSPTEWHSPAWLCVFKTLWLRCTKGLSRHFFFPKVLRFIIGPECPVLYKNLPMTVWLDLL